MSSAGDTKHLVFFADPDYYGGAEGIIAMLAEGRPKTGWRLSAMIPHGDGGEVLANKMSLCGVEVHRFRMRSFADPRLWWEIASLLRRIGGEILHLNLPYVYSSCLTVPALLAKLVGYKRVVTTEHLPMVDRARTRMMIKMALVPWIDKILVQTEWNKNILVSKHHMPSGKILVIPNGAAEPPHLEAAERETLRKDLEVAPDEVAIGMVGSLIKRKGHRFLFEALSQIKETNWRLLIIGEGEEEEVLRRQVDELGLASRIQFLGFRLDVRRIIAACDMLVLPSTLETQPLVITEAMSSGLPVVASAIYGIPETIEDQKEGFLVPPREIGPLTEALARMISDDQLRLRMGRAARERYEKDFKLELISSLSYAAIAGV